MNQKTRRSINYQMRRLDEFSQRELVKLLNINVRIDELLSAADEEIAGDLDEIWNAIDNILTEFDNIENVIKKVRKATDEIR